jgi:hypothetical protein
VVGAGELSDKSRHHAILPLIPKSQITSTWRPLAQRAARRISKKIAGAKRVVNELEICSCDGGGGA